MKRTILFVAACVFVIPAYATDYEITTPSTTSNLTLLAGDSLYMTAGRIGNLLMYGDSTAVIEGTSFGYPGGGAILCLPECFDIQKITMSEIASLAVSGGKIKQLKMSGRATAVLAEGDTIRVGQIDMSGFSSLTMSKGKVDRINFGDPSGGIVISISRPEAVLTGGTIGQIYAPRPLFQSGYIYWDETTQTWIEVEIPDEPAVTIDCRYYSYDALTHALTGQWMDGTTFSIQLMDAADHSNYGPTIDNIHFIELARDIYIDDSCTINDAVLENDRVHVGYNGPAWVNLADNARVGWTYVYRDSGMDMRGGTIVQDLRVDDARVYMSGGTVGGRLEVVDNGMIRLYGTDFEVTDLNGVTTALKPRDSLRDFATLVSEEGQPPYYAGTIKGNLVYGSVLNNTFKIDAAGNADILVYRFMASAYRVVALSQAQETGLLMRKNSALTVARDGHPLAAEIIVVNASGKDALRIQGDVSIAADVLSVAGGIDIKGTMNHPEDMGIAENLGEAAMMPGFFEEIPEPEYAGLPDMCPLDAKTGRISPLVINGGQHVLQPGYYSAGIIVEGATVTLMPGIYHLGGGTAGHGGLILQRGAVVDANDVMFHIVENGKVFIDDGAVLTAKPTSDIYQGLVFFQSRQNMMTAILDGTVDCSGILYFPANHLVVGGNVSCTTVAANTIELSSNAALTID